MLHHVHFKNGRLIEWKSKHNNKMTLAVEKEGKGRGLGVGGCGFALTQSSLRLPDALPVLWKQGGKPWTLEHWL